MPQLGPSIERPAYDAARSRITQVMQGLAPRDGDIEGLVSAMSRDLSRPDSFTEIARL